jgi:hypothetical protein
MTIWSGSFTSLELSGEVWPGDVTLVYGLLLKLCFGEIQAGADELANAI